ncbi:MAG TPA: 30S ribosome-binding factor RbfA [Mycobacteriales bacterium]|jgi:ribosome-binding factor A
MTDVARARRLADRIKTVVAETVERGIKDPRLGFVTFTDARVTPDLREATLFYTVYGDDTARAETAAALESAKGVLRAEIGKQCRLRFTPTLAFTTDQVPETAEHIEALVREAREADARVAAAAAAATYAGDADPYRKPAEDDEE